MDSRHLMSRGRPKCVIRRFAAATLRRTIFLVWCVALFTVNVVAQQPAAPLADPVLAAPSTADPVTADPVTAGPPSIPFSDEELADLRELIDESNGDAETRVSYANGFLLTVPAGDDGESFRMRINSWFQLRHTLFDSDTTAADQNDIEFERLRLTLAGHVYIPELTYAIQYDGDSDQSEVSDWLDYYMNYDLGHHLLCCQANRFGIKFGKWKLPFNRTRHEAGWKLAFADRSVASVFFDINRSLGVGIYGQLPTWIAPVNYEMAVFNGFKTGGFRPVRQGELDREFGFSARVFSDVIGQWGSDGESDLQCHTRPAVRVGAGIATTQFNNNDGPREFSRASVVDSGATLSSILPGGVDRYRMMMAAVDANLKYQGFTLLTEYYFRTLTDFSGAAVPDLFDHGFLLQTGMFLVTEKLELVSRWSRVVGDSGTLGAVDQSFDEVAMGLVWYWRGHWAKLTFDATHLNGAPIRDLALNILPGDDGMLYRTQLQIRF